MLFLNSWRVSSHRVRYDTIALQLFKNSINTQEKLRLNLHSFSVSELLEYGRKAVSGFYTAVSGFKAFSLLALLTLVQTVRDYNFT